MNTEGKFNLSQHYASFTRGEGGGGRLYENWKLYTKDPYILSIIEEELKQIFQRLHFKVVIKYNLGQYRKDISTRRT